MPQKVFNYDEIETWEGENEPFTTIYDEPEFQQIKAKIKLKIKKSELELDEKSNKFKIKERIKFNEKRISA